MKQIKSILFLVLLAILPVRGLASGNGGEAGELNIPK